MEMPALPRAGDYISVRREGVVDERADYNGSEDFIVRRVWWHCSYPDDGKLSHTSGSEPVGVAEVNVECEFAISPYSSKAHQRSANTAKRRAEPQTFEESNY
jgi:hypothetical protein